MSTLIHDHDVTDDMFGRDTFKLYEGAGPSGVHTVLHFEGRQMVIEKVQDMEPILRHVQAMRERNEGKPWGEGKEVGHIPEIFYAPIAADRDRFSRKRRIKAFFRQYPAFCAYPAYLKD